MVSLRIRCEDRRNLGFAVCYRAEDWPTGVRRMQSISLRAQPKVIEGMTPGRYEFSISPAGADVTKFDISNRITVEVGSKPQTVELTVPLLR